MPLRWGVRLPHSPEGNSPQRLLAVAGLAGAALILSSFMLSIAVATPLTGRREAAVRAIESGLGSANST